MVRINKIGKIFGLKCELRECFLRPVLRPLWLPGLGVRDGPLGPPWG